MPADGTVTPQSTAADIAEAINRQHTEIIALRAKAAAGDRTETEIRETLANMEASTAQLLRLQKHAALNDNGGSVDGHFIDARYIDEQGKLHLASWTERETLPDGSVDDCKRYGLLDDPRPVGEEIIEFRKRYLEFGIAFRLARSVGRSPWGSVAVKESFRAFKRAGIALPGRTGKLFAEFVRASNGGTGTGAELLSVPTISQLRRPNSLERRLSGLIKHVEVRTPSFKPPAMTGRALPRLRGTTQDDPSRYPVQTPVTSSATKSIVNFALSTILDPIWLADAEQVLAEPMAGVADWVNQGWLDLEELAILHGDTAGTQDTPASWTVGSYFAAAQLSGTDSPVLGFNGVRKNAFGNSNSGSGAGVFSLALHYAALAAMGVHGDKSIMTTGLSTFYKSILGNSAFTSVQNFGQFATAITGTMGSVGKTQITLSDFMPDDFDNTTGKYTGSNAKGEIVYWDPTAFVMYEMMQGAGDFDADYPERGARYVGGTRRMLLDDITVNSEKPAYVLYSAT